MSTQSAKIAISLPQETFRALERLRQESGLGRSAAIFEALGLWLKAHETKKLEAKYVQGYRKKPEKASDHDALFRAGLAGFTEGGW